MKLWILEPCEPRAKNWACPWDTYLGFVIRADSESIARAFASKHPGDEGAEAWTDPALSTCMELVPDGEPGIVLSDFHAG